MSCASGKVTITTGAVGTTFTVSGLPFQPTAILFAWSGKTVAGAAEQDSRFGVGMAVSTSSRRAFTTFSDHAVGTSVCRRGSANDCCVFVLNAGVSAGKADLDAILSDGFRLIVDTQFGAAIDVIWMAWDATNAQIVDFADPSGTGNQDYATSFALNTGLDDKCIIIAGTGWGTLGTIAGASCLSVGAAAGDTPVNAVLGAGGRDGGTSDTASYCRAGEIIANALSTGVEQRAALTAWLSTGFRLNWTEAPNFGAEFSALVMQGANRWEVGDALTSTGTTNQAEPTAYTPTGLAVLSHCKAQSTADTPQSHDERSIGFATGATNRNCVSLVDPNALNTTDIAVGYHDDRVYMNYLESNNNRTTVSGIMDLVSFDATPGFTYVMDDADPAAAFFWYLVTADVPVTGVTGTSSRQLALTSSATGQVLVQGASSLQLQPGGTVAGAVRVLGTSSKAVPVTGSGDADVRVGGASTRPIAITGTADGDVAIAAASARALAMTPAGSGQVLVRAMSAQQIAMTGVASGGSGAEPITGVSDRQLQVSGAATGQVLVQAASTRSIAIGGVAAASIWIVGVSTMQWPIGGVAAGAVRVRGDSAVLIPVSGIATAIILGAAQWISFGPVRELQALTFLRDLARPTSILDITPVTRVRALTS